MKFRAFLDKHAWTILAIIAILAAVMIFVVIRINATSSIDDQVKELYEKSRLVEQDFSNAHNLSGVVCYINEATNLVIFNAKDCTLKVAYDKSGELLTKEFTDNRIGANFVATIFTVIGGGVLSFMIFGVALIGLDEILRKAEEKRLAKARAQKNTDVAV